MDDWSSSIIIIIANARDHIYPYIAFVACYEKVRMELNFKSLSYSYFRCS